jgi:hypothetical protein
MALNKSNRIILLAGAGVAVLAAVLAASLFTRSAKPTTEAPPAAQGGLTVEVAEAPGLEPSRELRCFVDGQFVGLATLSDCAQRNGVATSALDVGLDSSGNLAAAPTAAFAPPPALPKTAPVDPVPHDSGMAEPDVSKSAPVQTGGTACLRFTGSDWRVIGEMSQASCVQALYAGTCVRPGEAQYGRWGDISLRLVPRRVEQSRDNVRFRTYAQQDRQCQFPELGR